MKSAVRTRLIVSLLAPLLVLTACLQWPSVDVSPTHPDKVLFDHAAAAIDHQRYEIARMTLQTLVNTYPESEYTAQARLILNDLKTAACEGRWAPGNFRNPTSECGEE